MKRKELATTDTEVLADMLEPENPHLAITWLKTRYDLLQQCISQKDKLLQILLGLVVAFGGVFEVTLCLCKNTCDTVISIILNAVCILCTFFAIAYISNGLRCTDDKDIENKLGTAKTFMDIKEFVHHYRSEVYRLECVLGTKKLFVKNSMIITLITGIISFLAEIGIIIIKFVQ